MRFSTLTSVLAAAGTAVGTFVPRDLITSALTAAGIWTSPDTEIFFPWSPEWDEVTARWKANDAPDFKAVIRPGNEEDVQISVKLATKFKIPFIAIGGGHSFGFESDFVGISINMGHFKSIDIDAQADTMTIGGSVLVGDILDPLFNAGKELPIGSCTCPGLVGITLGAGVGRYQGVHGLIVDSLLSVRLVTAKGDVVVVSETENPDLFWAIRGAGHNFGIVTEATYRIYDLSNNGDPILSADLVFPASVNESYFNLVKQYHDNLPPNFTLFGGMSYDPNAGPVLAMSLVYIGPEAEGRALIQPFLDLGPIAQNVYLVPFNEMIQAANFGLDGILCQKGQVLSPAPLSMKQIDVPTWIQTLERLVDFWETTPAARGTGILTELMHPGKMMEVGEDETAYPWRDVTMWAVVMAMWSDDAVGDDTVAFVRSVRDDIAVTSGYPDLQVYVNYVNGDETLEQIYGASKLPKLAQLKKKWDPKGVFSYYRPLPTKYP